MGIGARSHGSACACQLARIRIRNPVLPLWNLSERFDAFESGFQDPDRIFIYADQAINRLGPCALARALASSFFNALFSYARPPARTLSLRCSKTGLAPCTSCTWPTRRHQEPENTTQHIHIIRRGRPMPNAASARALSGCTLKPCVRARPAPLSRCAAPTTTVDAPPPCC